LGYVKRENGRPLKNTKGNVEDLSSGMEGSTKNTDKQIQWRRTKVLELSSQGNTQSDIAKTLHVGEATVSRDISSLRQQAQLNLKTHINDKLPEEYQNCMVGINQVLKICWEIVNKSRNVDNDNSNGQTMTVIDNKTVLQALALINECNKYKMDLTTNGVVISDAIKFVQTNQEKLTMSAKEEDKGSKESKEPDYDEDKNQLEEKQEEETGETTNQVF
jgi:predicted transcriptional regulator